MKVAIMQPYFLPYIGYWQLMNAVDVFVIYDNIKYTKKGWINRNRLLLNGQPETFTLPLKSDSDSLDINQRFLSSDFDASKMQRKIYGAYKGSDVDVLALQIIDASYSPKSHNLFQYLNHSIEYLRMLLGIKTKIIKSSDLPFDHKQYKGQDKVLAICEHLGATQYINPIGGTELYSHQAFSEKNIELKFLKSRLTPYSQFGNDFVPALSIIDPILCVGLDKTREMLGDYDLV